VLVHTNLPNSTNPMYDVMKWYFDHFTPSYERCFNRVHGLHRNVLLRVGTRESTRISRFCFNPYYKAIIIPLPVTGFGPIDGPAFKIHITQPQSGQMPPE